MKLKCFSRKIWLNRIELIVNRNVQVATVPSKKANSREPCFQTTQYGWTVGSVVPGRTSTLSRCPWPQGTSELPGPCPCLSLPGPFPAIRTSRLCLRATPRASAGSCCSQSARALRVTSPGPRINCQVAHRGFHSSWLIRRVSMSSAEGLGAPPPAPARASWGQVSRFPGAKLSR